MSFCSDVKNELSRIRPSECCKLPLTYGFLLFSRSFCADKISMQTENLTTAKLYAKLLKDCYGAQTTILEGGGKRKTYRATVESEFDRLKILASVDFGIFGGKINTESFVRECCSRSFIRGAFLACGRICDPDACYRVDFTVKDFELASELKTLLVDHSVFANISKRQNGYVVYIKQSDSVINLLTVIGETTRSLELIDTTMMRNVSNKTNRTINCDNANINRTVEASMKQRRAINELIKSGKLETLPDDIKAVAILRLEHPSESLKVLSEMTEPKMTVSALNRRLSKIISIYENTLKK